MRTLPLWLKPEKIETTKMTPSLKPFATGLLLLGLLATPAMAQEEPNAYPITDVNLRAGPGTEYPVLVTVPTDAPITILGCLEDYAWCDTIFEEQRGWMRSIYLAGYYEGEYYLLSDYAPDLGYQIVTFDVAAYWDAYYQDEPFYNDQYRVTEARGEGWVDEGVFYDRLSPHGAWTWTQGQYVWVPTGVGASWRPYTRGRWIYTDYGWTWASDEPFGWATYHYGRWGYASRIGCFWVPGNRWGPAWVSWQQSDDYLAWAPLPPAYSPGVSINISFGDIPAYYWSAVPSRYFLSADLPRYYIHDYDRRQRLFESTRPIGHTTIVNNTVVNNVVNVNYVEQHTNETVVEHQIRRTRDFEKAGRVEGDVVEVYRPGLQEARGRFAPEDPTEIEEVANLSKTKGQARGEATTEELLAPPEVREAIKKRKGGGPKGDALAEGKPSTIEPEALSPELPKGREAKGPPPSTKKARTRPIPAHDLGTPQETKSKQQAPSQAQQEKPRGPDKKAPPKQEAKPEQKAPSSAQQEKPRGPEKKAPPKQEAKPKQQAPSQAGQSQGVAAGSKVSSGKKNKNGKKEKD